MKVLIIGGYAPSLVNFRGHLIACLVERGHEVHAAAPGLLDEPAITDRLRQMGSEVHDVALQRTGMNPARDMLSLWSLVALMRRIRPDVVLAYTVKPVIWGMLAAAVTRVRRRFALITGVGYAFTGEMSGRRRYANWIATTLYRLALSNASKVLFQNEDDADLFRSLGILSGGKDVAIMNGSGVDIDRFAPAPLPSGPPSFVLIARLLNAKGIREFAEAAEQVRKSHRDAAFHLVGPTDPSPDGIPRGELQRWIESGAIVWHGEAEDVRPYIAASKVYVLPSYREGTPRSVLEAMAMGRPIITTDVPGCRETVVDGVNGFLVPARSPDALAAAMIRFIEAPGLAERMAAESRVIAERKYDVRVVNAAMLEEMGLA